MYVGTLSRCVVCVWCLGQARHGISLHRMISAEECTGNPENPGNVVLLYRETARVWKGRVLILRMQVARWPDIHTCSV